MNRTCTLARSSQMDSVELHSRGPPRHCRKRTGRSDTNRCWSNCWDSFSKSPRMTVSDSRALRSQSHTNTPRESLAIGTCMFHVQSNRWSTSECGKLVPASHPDTGTCCSRTGHDLRSPPHKSPPCRGWAQSHPSACPSQRCRSTRPARTCRDRCNLGCFPPSSRCNASSGSASHRTCLGNRMRLFHHSICRGRTLGWAVARPLRLQ